MENLEAQEKILNLGKLFVEELKLEPGVDTFSRWMAHYLAEKMSLLEKLEGDDKLEAQNLCFDVILKLWKHRHYLPNNRRPLQSFEGILETLSKLNADTTEPFFYKNFRNQDLRESKIENLAFKDVQEWMKIAEDIDKTSRIWIEYILNQAITIAKNEKTKEWVQSAVNLPDSEDAKIINILLDNTPLFETEVDNDLEKFSKNYDIEKLNKRISELEKYAKFNELLLNSYKEDLKNKLN